MSMHDHATTCLELTLFAVARTRHRAADEPDQNLDEGARLTDPDDLGGVLSCE